LNSRVGQAPIGPYWRGRPDRPLVVRGGESRPGETPGAVTPPAAPPAEPATPPAESEPFDAERARRTIENLRQFERDAKALKKERDDLKARVDQHEAASLSESEKLTKKVADLEKSLADAQTERRAILVRAEIERQARKLGVVDEGVAYKLLDLDGLAFDESGNPVGVEKALTKLLEQHPFLKATSEARPGVPATPRPNGHPQTDRIEENRQKLRATGAYARF